MVTRIVSPRRLSFESIVVTFLVFLVHATISDIDTDLIPADKSHLDVWFRMNVGPVSDRRVGLDPVLVKAESNRPKIIYVKQDGSGDFKTIGEAIRSVPKNNMYRTIIHISGGNYTEKLRVDRYQTFVTLYGDPHDVPNILFNGDAMKYGTVDSATLIVEATADYFMGVNLNIINTSPRPDGQALAQAVALRASGAKGAYYNVKMYGFQDTLCDDAGHHLFKDCYIEGTMDFVFGNAKSLYLNTELRALEGSAPLDVITAHANDKPNVDTGFSFVHCTVTGNTTQAFLGRTWRTYPKVIFSYTNMARIVSPAGWLTDQNTAKTAYFAEYKSSGAGARPKQRGSFVKMLSGAQVKPYITLGHINASSWLLRPPKI